MRFMRAADAPDDWWITLRSQLQKCPAAKASWSPTTTLFYRPVRNNPTAAIETCASCPLIPNHHVATTRYQTKTVCYACS